MLKTSHPIIVQTQSPPIQWLAGLCTSCASGMACCCCYGSEGGTKDCVSGHVLQAGALSAWNLVASDPLIYAAWLPHPFWLGRWVEERRKVRFSFAVVGSSFFIFFFWPVDGSAAPCCCLLPGFPPSALCAWKIKCWMKWCCLSFYLSPPFLFLLP